ncbi:MULTISPECIES: PQQ-dependent sugar dehydrogenase [Haloarcula]|uniref:PQQ-dependent sugar dehydrogenase n=1 Tax=Haloarcula TaxID=2237 RepID=UPI0023EC9B5E|nr:PQQ-dependent sugar dehydrogenase [Halomicroarcula sp. XH51]
MVTQRRRQFLRAGLLGLGGLAGCVGPGGPASSRTEPADDTGPSPPSPDESPDQSLASLELTGDPVADGFTAPVDVLAPRPDEYFVADQAGVVTRIGPEGESRPVLDVRDRMVSVSGYDERGLLGLALHPDYDGDGRLFVRYSAPRRPGTPENFSHTFVLAEFAVRDGSVDEGSERTVLEIPQPQSNHNAGAVTFGPDGYLYVAVGDGGAGGDRGRGHVDDWYDAVEGGNGQDVTENLLGSILRLDVDDAPSGEPYGIPDDNPLAGESGLDEHYAWGFRNPWRFSFGPDGRFFVADVGQSEFEEVNLVERGGNYGWNVREATHCFDASDCPTETADGRPLADPIIEYPHGGSDVSGVSVIGGYLYDGASIPALDGRYVFADWRANGRLFVASERDRDRWPVRAVPIVGEDVGQNVLAFGRTTAGELLACTTERGGVSGESGVVHQIRER